MLINKDIRQINKTLDIIKSEATNTKLTTQTFNKDVCDLCDNINEILDERQKTIIKFERTNNEFKRAITNISHDMRTPLTSAIGYLQMLQAENIPVEKQAEYLEIIENRLQSLSTLMNNLFEYARVIERTEQLDIKEVNINNVLRDILSEFYNELENKGFTVDAEIPNEQVNVFCDPSLLKRILQNLLKNVCAHGKEFLRVKLSGNVIEIANKADLDEIDVDKIFERFYTTDLSRTNRNTGLGLAIAKELATQINSKISAKVEDELLIMQIKL
ncbi:MAG: HAMP domain-containing histidine kinase [Oscillospiraceae bacterium]|jgi:signal transduction histidine kinase|nr:HAMP domain-containing histidine kinase [Oscillospiraceae bacterium]